MQVSGLKGWPREERKRTMERMPAEMVEDVTSIVARSTDGVSPRQILDSLRGSIRAVVPAPASGRRWSNINEAWFEIALLDLAAGGSRVVMEKRGRRQRYFVEEVA